MVRSYQVLNPVLDSVEFQRDGFKEVLFIHFLHLTLSLFRSGSKEVSRLDRKFEIFRRPREGRRNLDRLHLGRPCQICGGEKQVGDFVAGGRAGSGGFAGGGFAEPEGVDGEGGEVGVGAPGVGVGVAEEGAGDVAEVAEGPVVAFDEGPEGDDEGVGFGVEPGAFGVRHHGAANGFPFWGVLKVFGEEGVEGLPLGFDGVGMTGEVELSAAKGGELAFFGVGIEADGGVVPVAMGVEVDVGVEPVAPALEGAAEQFKCRVQSAECRMVGVGAEKVAGEFVFQHEWNEGIVQGFGNRVFGFGELEHLGCDAAEQFKWRMQSAKCRIISFRAEEVAEECVEGAPGLAGLEGTVAGLFFGVFGDGLIVEGGEPEAG